MTRADITGLFPEATKEQVDKILDLNGNDIGKAKTEMQALKDQLSSAQTELAALRSRPIEDHKAELDAVTQELNSLKAANALRDIRTKVSRDTGVPMDLLTGETEEACKNQADMIKAYAQPSRYPKVPDGGEAHPGGSSATRDKFAEWFSENMN